MDPARSRTSRRSSETGAWDADEVFGNTSGAWQTRRKSVAEESCRQIQPPTREEAYFIRGS